MRITRLLALAALVAACGGAGGGAPSPTQPPTSRCQDAQQALVSAVSTGLDAGQTIPSTSQLSLRNAKVVKSSDFESAYFFAADLQGVGLEGSNEIGLWVSNKVDGTGSVYAVDAVANEFSVWEDGRTTEAAFSSSDDGAAEAKACAGI